MQLSMDMDEIELHLEQQPQQPDEETRKACPGPWKKAQKKQEVLQGHGFFVLATLLIPAARCIAKTASGRWATFPKMPHAKGNKKSGLRRPLQTTSNAKKCSGHTLSASGVLHSTMSR
eukprot:6491288-Amphidinium_carterae.2